MLHTTPTASASTIFPTVTGTAWNVHTSSSSPRNQSLSSRKTVPRDHAPLDALAPGIHGAFTLALVLGYDVLVAKLVMQSGKVPGASSLVDSMR